MGRRRRTCLPQVPVAAKALEGWTQLIKPLSPWQLGLLLRALLWRLLQALGPVMLQQLTGVVTRQSVDSGNEGNQESGDDEVIGMHLIVS
jgi:hypothetical protein